jgi:hypothetical protein
MATSLESERCDGNGKGYAPYRKAGYDRRQPSKFPQLGQHGVAFPAFTPRCTISNKARTPDCGKYLLWRTLWSFIPGTLDASR